MPEMRVHAEITGTSSLLFHRFTGQGSIGFDQVKDPREHCKTHLYFAPELPLVYIPGPAIFASLVNAGVFMKKSGGTPLTTAKRTYVPDRVTLIDEVCLLRGADGRVVTADEGWEVSTSGVDTLSSRGVIRRYRPEVAAPWSLSFTAILHDSLKFWEDPFRHLLEIAGTRVGLLAFRPQKNGTHGKFKVTKLEVLVSV